MSVLDFVLPKALEAHEPPEARGLTRDGVRMLVTEAGEVRHHRFTDLPAVLRPGDLLVVNTSGTLPAAVPVAGSAALVHFSTELDDGRWLVEPRGAVGPVLRLAGGCTVRLVEPYSEGRLWIAAVDPPGGVLVREYLFRYGQPIRYGYVPGRWPLRDYQTVFATEPGSAEMPSAGRPFTERLVTRLVTAGIGIAPILLHTGVASAEAHERPYAERFAVPDSTATAVNAARAGGGRVVAIGTTVVRALESAVSADGPVCGRRGWTDLVITPERGVAVVDGLLTGLHEPRASHLDLLAAIVDRCLLDRSYAEALHAGYLWHEFGDVHLILP
jgi:S-adenosylmethionine:tRNA ribosyltransferase-isomerase